MEGARYIALSDSIYINEIGAYTIRYLEEIGIKCPTLYRQKPGFTINRDSIRDFWEKFYGRGHF